MVVRLARNKLRAIRNHDHQSLHLAHYIWLRKRNLSVVARSSSAAAGPSQHSESYSEPSPRAIAAASSSSVGVGGVGAESMRTRWLSRSGHALFCRRSCFPGPGRAAFQERARFTYDAEVMASRPALEMVRMRRTCRAHARGAHDACLKCCHFGLHLRH